MLEENHAVIVIPGLGDESSIYPWLMKTWKKDGFDPIVHSVHWHNGRHFTEKLKRIVQLGEQLRNRHRKISIIGNSAGGSAAFNAFISQPKLFYKAVNNCGRLRPGGQKGFRSFESRTASSLAFRESVELFSKEEHSLPPALRKRTMTIHPRWGDELVPVDTNILDGAYNLTLPSAEHMLTIGLALTMFSQKIESFLQED